jgi:peptide deformylase
VSLLRIRLFGDPVLKSRAHEVTEFDDALERLADDMMATMRAADGAGLAATQVGVLKRLFTWEAREESGAFVNPEILDTSEEVEESDEGCLSFPGLFYPTRRPLQVSLRIQDVHGEEHKIEAATPLQARIFLHEIDHLNGILFIEHLKRHDRKDAMRRIRNGELEHPPPRPPGEPPPA